MAFPLPRARTSSWLLVPLALLIALPCAAQWKWRDARGQVHVSDLPPPREVPDRDVLQRPASRPAATAGAAASPASAASVAAAASSAAPADAAAETRRRRDEAEQARRAKAQDERNAAIRHDNCQRARSMLASLESGRRLARPNARGEIEVLDDAARAVEVRRAQDVIASDCA